MMERLISGVSPYAKACKAYSCNNAQYFRNPNSLHQDTTLHRISLGTFLLGEIIVHFYGEYHALSLRRRGVREVCNISTQGWSTAEAAQQHD